MTNRNINAAATTHMPDVPAVEDVTALSDAELETAVGAGGGVGVNPSVAGHRSAGAQR